MTVPNLAPQPRAAITHARHHRHLRAAPHPVRARLAAITARAEDLADRLFTRLEAIPRGIALGVTLPILAVAVPYLQLIAGVR